MFVAVLLCVLACSSDQPDEGPVGFTSEDVQRQVQELYRQAKEAGERVPADAYEWASSDLKKIGDWEYQVLHLNGASDGEIQQQLNDLGTDRWEVFWLDPTEAGFRAFAKRPARSYLRQVPLSELSRLVPGGSASE